MALKVSFQLINQGAHLANLLIGFSQLFVCLSLDLCKSKLGVVSLQLRMFEQIKKSLVDSLDH